MVLDTREGNEVGDAAGVCEEARKSKSRREHLVEEANRLQDAKGQEGTLETLRVVLCVGQVRVLTCVLVSFCVTGETKRGRESGLRCPARP